MFKSKFPVPQEVIASSYIDACQLEVRTLKPGNVHVFAEGHRMTAKDFDHSAEISAPFLSQPGLSVGERIWRSVEATINALHTNTNLGIVLLCAPIAAAAGPLGHGESLQERIIFILKSLTHADASQAYKAISKANPAGLRSVIEGDVAKDPPTHWTLQDAMKESASHDLIAAQYASFFLDIVECTGLYHNYLKKGACRENALSFLYLQKLSQIKDTHIIRKHGDESAQWVRKATQRFMVGLNISEAQDLSSPQKQARLLAFDKELKERGYNPGSLADIMCATAFYFHLNSPHSEISS